VRDHDLGVPLDLQARPLAHLARRGKDLLGNVVQVLRAAAAREGQQVEVEVLDVRVAPLLRLLRRDREREELVEGLLAERLDERRG
jgi:hypothetical protein